MQREIKTSRFNVVNFGKTIGTQSLRVQGLYKRKRKIPHKSWNSRVVFDMDLKSNTGYNNHEYTNVGEQGLCGVILADRRAV